MRGERTHASAAIVCVGLTPAMRGNIHPLAFRPRFVGITPAYAGRSWLWVVFRVFIRDHPRVRGEKPFSNHYEYTPRDHPRVRGEKAGRLHAERTGRGSPPRTRGEVTPIAYLIDAVRITPAYAGRRYNRWIGSWGIRDHPRVRGEKTRSSIAEYASGGSPPRTRGEEGEPEHKAEDDRITPAYAGRRGRLRLANSSAGDHPRVRGEKQRTSISYMSAMDHPRVRGEKLEPAARARIG